jgi:hypothetical protein
MTRTLIGGCGNDGCLDCTPTFVEILDDDEFDDGTYEIHVIVAMDGES